VLVLLLVSQSQSTCGKRGVSRTYIEHVHYVDSGTNFLFRGSSPDVNNDQFDYQALQTAIESAASAEGITLPATYVINDIDVMTFADGSYDGMESLSEFEYYRQNPSAGSYIFWRTTGTNTNATSTTMTKALRDYLTSTYAQWAPDMLMTRAKNLKVMLNSPAPVPIVYYLHCDCGCDRTGEVIGAYYMTQMNMSWAQVVALNTKIAGRSQCCPMYLGMQWFCLYLNTQGFALGNCLKYYDCFQC